MSGGETRSEPQIQIASHAMSIGVGPILPLPKCQLPLQDGLPDSPGFPGSPYQ